MSPPPFSARDWPRWRDVATMAMTVVLLLAWLVGLAVAWVRWTARSDLESAVLVVLAGGVVAMLVGFVRAAARHRRLVVDLARSGVWVRGAVVAIDRGFDPRGIEVGVPYRWIVTAKGVVDGREAVLRSAPVRRLRDVKGLMGAQVWVRVDPADPARHVVVPRGG